jgi:hypothetical protein
MLQTFTRLVSNCFNFSRQKPKIGSFPGIQFQGCSTHTSADALAAEELDHLEKSQVSGVKPT